MIKKILLALLLMFPLLAVAKPITVGVDIYPSGTMRVLVGVADEGVADFMVDTGASGILMPEKVMKDLVKRHKAKKVGEEKSGVADGRELMVDLYEISEVNLMGVCKIPKVIVSSFRGSDNSMFLLGMDVLSRVSPFTVDTQKKTITFECKTDG